MKTHKARWAQNSPTTWILKEPSRDGGAVLATIVDLARSPSGGYGWKFGEGRLGTFDWLPTRRACQRAVRAALAALAKVGVE